MAGNRIVFDGLAELKAALRTLPAELAQEAGEIVKANAAEAAREIRADYPSRTGNLKNHVYVTNEARQFGASAVVKNTAKHAWLYDNGSQARHTDIGANRGSMPAAPTGRSFVAHMIRRRRIMYQILKDLLVSKGLMVSGDA